MFLLGVAVFKLEDFVSFYNFFHCLNFEDDVLFPVTLCLSVKFSASLRYVCLLINNVKIVLMFMFERQHQIMVFSYKFDIKKPISLIFQIFLKILVNNVIIEIF
jgi:hypothetical protein